jgi:hypothetical protein
MWGINGEDWYKIYGHQFEVVDMGDTGDTNNAAGGFTAALQVPMAPDSNKTPTNSYFFTLPIPPQSISIKPIFPNQVTPTAGGVVEEVSQVSLWQIQMSGTMGTAVSRSIPSDRNGMADQFRTRIATTGLLAGISASLQEGVNKIGAIANKVVDTVDAVQSGNPLDAAGAIAGGVTGALNEVILPPLPYAESGVHQNSNGFTETHELQKFFYLYHKLKGDNPNKFFLRFNQIKTGQTWNVIVKNYTIRQSATNPNLYRYEIALIGWDCRKLNAAKRNELNRFGPKGDLSAVNTVGTGVFSKLKTVGKQLF